MKVITVEEQRYHEFNNSMGDNDVMELLYLKLPDDSKNLPMMFHISQSLVVNIVDRMLGGEGDEQDLDAGYSYTDIELALDRAYHAALFGDLQGRVEELYQARHRFDADLRVTEPVPGYQSG